MISYRGKRYSSFAEYEMAKAKYDIREDELINFTPDVSLQKKENIPDVTFQRKELYVRGLSGLKNMGNTCYMNSIIQCLSSISIFRTYIINIDNFLTRLEHNVLMKMATEKRKQKSLPETSHVQLSKKMARSNCEDSLVIKLSELLTAMWKQNREVEPRDFKKIIGKYCSMFNGYNQNDSQELLNLILDTIHEELKSEVLVKFQNIPKGVSYYLDVQSECNNKANDETLSLEERQKYLDYLKHYTVSHRDDSIIANAYVYWKNYIQKSHSIISDLFTGLFYSKIICSVCNAVTGAFEPFTTLSLQTKETGETTLEESLDSFVKEELLCGDNQYHCSDCKKKVDATKKMHIWSPPNVLIVQLKRFKSDTKYETKTTSKVVFPTNNLDLKNYLSDLHSVNKTKYDLVAISEHRGTCNFGHYVAYCKNDINNKWYEFNDDDVFHVPYSELESEIVTENAYILFYVKQLN